MGKFIPKIELSFPWMSLPIHSLFLFWEAALLSIQPSKKAWSYLQFLPLSPHGKPREDYLPGCLLCLCPVLSPGPMSTSRALSHKGSLYIIALPQFLPWIPRKRVTVWKELWESFETYINLEPRGYHALCMLRGDPKSVNWNLELI